MVLQFYCPVVLVFIHAIFILLHLFFLIFFQIFQEIVFFILGGITSTTLHKSLYLSFPCFKIFFSYSFSIVIFISFIFLAFFKKVSPSFMLVRAFCPSSASLLLASIPFVPLSLKSGLLVCWRHYLPPLGFLC